MADQFPGPTKMVLSPAAQAVLRAYREEWGQLAAALRAAADQLDHSTSEHILQTIATELESYS